MISVILDVLVSNQFVEKLLVIFVGALLTGALVPLVKSSIDRRTFQDRKRFEASLSQQASVLSARARFAKRFSCLIWEYHFLMLEVSYDRLWDAEGFEDAKDRFNVDGWRLLKEIRGLVSGARWFLADDSYGRLEDFCTYLLSDATDELSDIIEEDPEEEIWKEFHERIQKEIRARSKSILLAISKDFHFDKVS